MGETSEPRWQRGTGGRRGTIVSFSRDKDEKISIEDEKAFLRRYLDEGVENFKCCGFCLPVPFERASKKSWWDPKFDSEILEGQYRQTAFSQIRLRFRYSLWYMLIVSLFWFGYLIVYGVRDHSTQKDAFPLGVIFFLFSVFCCVNLAFTGSRLFRRYRLPVSAVFATSSCLLSLVSVVASPGVLSPAGDFALCVEVLLIVYTLVPLPLYATVCLAVIYSVVFETLGSRVFFLPVRVLSHVCVHLVALHILIMTNVRMRGTFMKVGQSLLVGRQLEKEKMLKEKMIHSVMPPMVADWLMKGGGGNHDGSSRPSGGVLNIFRPFNMNCMQDVSILFADIVGFTKMSSNKTASELVSILNELFERFDELCSHNGCEKIATLGDCYYCVSGCPTPRRDHAQCCVQMGLGMIDVIAEFDRVHHEDVNMRVGVHTGIVLCGIVGTRRFKFDVWSNDVSLANKMESTGEPGRVHISQATKDFLNDEYILEQGKVCSGMNTFFIVKRRGAISHPDSNTMTSPTDPSPQFLSFETEPGSEHNPIEEGGSSSMVTAPESSGTSRSQPSVHCTVSPFEKHLETELFTKKTPIFSSTPTTPLPSARAPGPPRLLCFKLATVKASSLPNVFGKPDSPGGRKAVINTTATASAIPPSRKGKYYRLKKSKLDIENGKVHHTFKSQPLLSDAEKVSANHLEVPRDDLSVCPSLNSRKDSGIKSNSRRSSIHQQLLSMNGVPQGELLAQRVSGYYTSSQSSLNNDSVSQEKESKLPVPLADSILHCQNLRKQSDLQLIKCVQDSQAYPECPLKMWSLMFRDKDLEKEYREKAHRTSPDEPLHKHTLATARFNTYFDITISLIVFASVSISSFIVFPLSIPWLTVFTLLFTVQFSVVFLCVRSSCGNHIAIGPWLYPLLRWYPWHGVGALLVSLPLVAVLVNFDKSTVTREYVYNYCYLFFVGIVHYCNFTQLNCWMKSSLATLGAVVYLMLVTITLLHHPELLDGAGNSTELSTENLFTANNTNFIVEHVVLRNKSIGEMLSRVPESKVMSQMKHKRFTSPHYRYIRQSSISVDSNFMTRSSVDLKQLHRSRRELHKEPSSPVSLDMIDILPTIGLNNTLGILSENITKSDSFLVEVYLDVFLLVLLIWFLNREFEISYRLSFHGNAQAAKDKCSVERLKNQAEWLLHNIIPKHVVEQLKNNSARYSEDVKDAGIIFASVTNFSEMYDESFMGGVEYLRVLNELVGDFDELLDQERFSMVEKIKTIGSTFMAASGLNLSERNGNNTEHLFQLMEFALTLQGVMDNFNAHLLSFNLEMRIGYNFGDVTAGVIGTKKLLYDIWGDAVNIASRMDSTGVKGKIQVPATCLPLLSQRYNFEHRGKVFVKGKDMMDVYLLAGRKQEGATETT